MQPAISATDAAQRTSWSASVPDGRLRRLASLVHQLGPRPLFELFRELVAGADPLARIEAYGAIDPDILEALGGDRFPDLLRAVPNTETLR
jgi:hypothetical protein